jgi:hypothetical protein
MSGMSPVRTPPPLPLPPLTLLGKVLITGWLTYLVSLELLIRNGLEDEVLYPKELKAIFSEFCGILYRISVIRTASRD